MTKYQRITKEERIHIWDWKQEGKSDCEIARLLHRSPSTIWRELKRHGGLAVYCPQRAQEEARERARREGPRRFSAEMMAEVIALLRTKRWSPAQISGRARREGRDFVCRESIYQAIYADARVGGDLWRCLTRAKRKRHRRCPRVEGRGRGRIPGRRDIDHRPLEVLSRATAGHWEGDLINGAPGTGHFVTLVDRKTRYLFIGRVKNKTSAEVCACVCSLLLLVPASLRKTVTFDNGKEFADHAKMAEVLGVEVFFAHPYHSWERGTNENTNGLIRRVYPKKSSFAAVGSEELAHLSRFVNERPRSCLAWATPSEEFEKLCEAAACAQQSSGCPRS